MFDINSNRFGRGFGETEDEVGQAPVPPVGLVVANPAIEQLGKIEELKGLKSCRQRRAIFDGVIHG
jgi:hypothetical protein